MLTIDEQLFDIDEAIDEVAASFLELESVKNYRKAREVFLADTVLQEKIMHFQARSEERRVGKEGALTLTKKLVNCDKVKLLFKKI